MKNLSGKCATILAAMMLLAAPAWGQSATRVGTVDLRKLFDNYWKTKQADAALKDRAADMEKQYKELTTDWQKKKEEYDTLLADANNQTLSSDERDKRKKSADDKLKQMREMETGIKQFQRTATETIDQQRNRMRDSIVDEIRNVLNAKAKAAGYTLVVDSSANSMNGTPIILYNGNDNDLTTEVLAQLNATASANDAAKTTATPEKKDEKKK